MQGCTAADTPPVLALPEARQLETESERCWRRRCWEGNSHAFTEDKGVVYLCCIP